MSHEVGKHSLSCRLHRSHGSPEEEETVPENGLISAEEGNMSSEEGQLSPGEGTLSPDDGKIGKIVKRGKRGKQ